MKCDEGTIKNSGYTLCPDCGVTEKEVEELLDKGKSNWTGEEKKKFKKATFGSNRYTVGGVILFIIVVLAFGQVLGGTVAAVAVSLFSLFKLSDPSAATSLLQKSFHINALGESVVALIGFAFMFLGIVIFAKPFLNTNIKHMIAGRKKFD